MVRWIMQDVVPFLGLRKTRYNDGGPNVIAPILNMPKGRLPHDGGGFVGYDIIKPIARGIENRFGMVLLRVRRPWKRPHALVLQVIFNNVGSHYRAH